MLRNRTGTNRFGSFTCNGFHCTYDTEEGQLRASNAQAESFSNLGNYITSSVSSLFTPKRVAAAGLGALALYGFSTGDFAWQTPAQARQLLRVFPNDYYSWKIATGARILKGFSHFGSAPSINRNSRGYRFTRIFTYPYPNNMKRKYNRKQSYRNSTSSLPPVYSDGVNRYNLGTQGRREIYAANGESEIKNIDQTFQIGHTEAKRIKFFGAAVIPTTAEPSAMTLHPIPRGVGANQREGYKVCIKGIEMHAELGFSRDTTSVDAIRSPNVTYEMWMDTQCNGVNPTRADIYDTDDNLSFRNRDNETRFVMLWSTGNISIPWRSGGSDALQVSDTFAFQAKVPLNIEVEWKHADSDGLVGALQNVNIVMLMKSTHVINSTSFTSIDDDMHVRVFYVDV